MLGPRELAGPAVTILPRAEGAQVPELWRNDVTVSRLSCDAVSASQPVEYQRIINTRTTHMAGKFIVFVGKDGQSYFRLRASSGCRSGMKSLATNAADATVAEE